MTNILEKNQQVSVEEANLIERKEFCYRRYCAVNARFNPYKAEYWWAKFKKIEEQLFNIQEVQKLNK